MVQEIVFPHVTIFFVVFVASQPWQQKLQVILESSVNVTKRIGYSFLTCGLELILVAVHHAARTCMHVLIIRLELFTPQHTILRSW